MYLRLTSLDTNRNEKFQKNISIIHEIISSFEIDKDVIVDTLNKTKVSINNYNNPQIIKVDHFECLGIKTPSEAA